MRNLKRALSFALACVMLVGMMVVGTSAAFTDADKISNEEAVNMLVALNVVNGKDDGSFDPAGFVKRGEMAKMICVALNGGTDPKLTEGGMYPDTKNHWARGYIDYCTNLGIVAGDTAGNFNPDAYVTGTEAAKMVLIALGYNAENEKFVNDIYWDKNINVTASIKGLFEGIDALPSAKLNREDAAQMIWNGVNAVKVKYTYVLNTVNGNLVSVAIAEDTDAVKDTILKDKFGTHTTAPEGEMTAASYDSTNKDWTYTINGETYSDVKADYTDLMYMNVKVVAKADNSKVYGIFAEDSAVIAEGFTNTTLTTAEDDGVNKVTLAGKKYKTDDGSAEAKYAMGGTADIAEVAKAKLVDFDGDSKVDFVVYTPFTVEKVTYVNSTKVRAGAANYTISSINIYKGVAVNDWVAITAAAYNADGKISIEKAELKTGTVSATKVVSGTTNYQINGKWFTLDTENADVAAINLNDTIEYVAYGSVLYYTKVTAAETTSNALALVVNAGSTEATYESAAANKAVLMYADGSKETVTVSAPATGLVGQLVTYYKNSNGKYVLTAVAADTNMAGYDEFEEATVAAATTGKITGTETYKLADDTIVFLFRGNNEAAGEGMVPNASNKAMVITGAEAKQMLASNYDAHTATVLGKMVNGFGYAKVVALRADTKSVTLGEASNSTVYGYLTAGTYNTLSNGKYYRNLTIWTANGELVVVEEFDSAPVTLAAGTAVTFKNVKAGEVEAVAAVSTDNFKVDAVTAWDGKNIKFENGTTTYVVNEKTVIIYVDNDAKKGDDVGEIMMAVKDIEGDYVPNVMVYAVDAEGTTDDVVKVIFVDINNEW